MESLMEKTSEKAFSIMCKAEGDEFEKQLKEMEELLLDVSLQFKGIEEMIEELEEGITGIEEQIAKLDVQLKEFEENSLPRLIGFNSKG
ncbi:hypothetical protein PUS82_14930 [Cytobacillus firmus]|uniref:hypothetical protein n=1 Tax=Cytobacillus firmus TaxID=1399 RepID=UPI00237C1B6E|nr:hypothetical protein [Cytobacillus firmus]MDD9312568.1 hypothetical protein [Cytobacillus firmus]